MCGINGIVAKRGIIDENRIQRMNDSIEHRGPDDKGIMVDKNIALGSRRLAIIDPSPSGCQPMSNEDGTIWMVFNGEFYNYMEYRNNLIASGHNYKSLTDSEVVIHLYEEHGIEGAIERINGMFAFAIYDKRLNQLFLVRDRLGIKPLFYSFDHNELIFSSELKGILQCKGVNRNIDPNCLALYFTYGYVPDPFSIFSDIKKLPPAQYLRLDIESYEISLNEYWDVDYTPNYSISEGHWLEQLDYLLEDSVKLRLRSDVPLGVQLSGGIDSTLIFCYMTRFLGDNINAFSVAFKERAYSEIKWAEHVVRRFPVRHFKEFVNTDVIELLPKLVFYYDEPFDDFSALPTYMISKRAREYVSVVLSGDGGDENFGGYSRYDRSFFFYKFYRMVPDFISNSILRLFYKIYPEKFYGKYFMERLTLAFEDMYLSQMSCFNQDYLNRFLKKNVQIDNKLTPFFRKVKKAHFLDQVRYIDLKTYLPMDILTKIDRASMAVSLESRVPFLDYRVVELCGKIPWNMHLRNGVNKYLLKTLLKGKFGFSDEFINRQKQGFRLPISEWFRGRLYSFLRKELLSEGAMIRKYVDQSCVEEMIVNHRRKTRNYTRRIWSVLFLEFWLRRWMGN